MAFHAAAFLGKKVVLDFKVRAVVDLTPADGLLAQAALHTRIPYTGLVFTPKHADELLQKASVLFDRRGDPRG